MMLNNLKNLKVYVEEHDVQSHMFRPTITDMQGRCCGNCYDVYLIQSQYKGNHKRDGAAEGRVTSFVVAAAARHLCKLALNRVNIVEVNTILVLHVSVIGHHVPRHDHFTFPRRLRHVRLCATRSKGPCLLGEESGGALGSPRAGRLPSQAEGMGKASPPPSSSRRFEERKPSHSTSMHFKSSRFDSNCNTTGRSHPKSSREN